MGFRATVLAAMLAALCTPVPADAATLALDGVWGNEAGCKFADTKNNSDDSLMVLTADGVETYATFCEWVQVGTAIDGTQVVTGLCGHEGEDYRSIEMYIVERDMADTSLIRIRASNGEPWGEVRKCP
jgi:hypothetical protein